jgi:hypothetical protein
MWFEIQGDTTAQNLNEQIAKWKSQAVECLCQAEGPDASNYTMGMLLYMEKYYKLLSEDKMVLSQFMQNQLSRSVRTDPRLIPALQLLSRPGSDKTRIGQAILDIIGLPSQKKRKQFHWPSNVKAGMITLWTILLPLLIFKKEPEFLSDLINKDILPYYDEIWGNITYNFDYFNRRDCEQKTFLM